jgi:RNA polymerase sigma-70 factor (ECF subfamily)
MHQSAETTVRMTYQDNPSQKDRPASKKEKSREEIQDFEAIFEQNWERVCSVAYQIIGDAHEAQDLALEAFLRLYQHPPTDQGNLVGWLYRVTTRLGLNALRSNRRRQGYEKQAEDPLNIEAQSMDPEKIQESTERQNLVRKTLQGLKPRSAQILVLRNVGFSYQEIADTLQIPASSVGTLLSRAEGEFEKAFLHRSNIRK